MTRCLITVWFCVIAVGALTAAEESNGVFPNVTGRSLQGNEIKFPQALAGKDHNLVIVAFTRKQQAMIDTWLPELAQLAGSNKDFGYYELPTIKKMNRVMKWVIYRGMRSGIKDADTRARTITLHIDKEPFKNQLGIKTEEDIFLFLTDNQGKIRWRTRGIFSKLKFRMLKSRVQKSAKID